MSVGLLLITHQRIGEELVRTARSIVSPCSLRTDHLSIPLDSDPPEMIRRGTRLLQRLDTGDGVLILTDAFGSTPSNVAVRLGELDRTAVVAGVNLPMLLRVMNYPDLPLVELQRKAISGGREGILSVERHEAMRNEPL